MTPNETQEKQSKVNKTKMNQINRLHQRAILCAKRFHEAESELLTVLQRVDAQKTFRHLGFPSLFAYATHALKLSEGTAPF